MNAEQKKVIKNTILECREILERDIEQVLINYGIYVDKNWINLRDLHFTEEQENTRIKIESAIEKLQKGGFDKNKAVKEYIKEVSYTNLNRLAALRVMEVRCLIEEILIRRSKYGNKSFIGSRFYEVAREYCKLETDGGLSYLLNVMYVEISEEIQMLFNMEDEYSFVFPSYSSLLKVIDLLCNNIDEESWKEDEIIGWVYQYFNDKEKDDVFDRLYNKKEKIRVEDIPAATQLFTPDWIVKWIVDNSLGTFWEEIKNRKRDWKRVEDIKLLDPCCGSGHFLVKSYDLFYKMYEEEGIYTKEEIPFKILENNLHGIDIDLRAMQLTGLVLFIKTKTYLSDTNYNINVKGKLKVNLVCADAILLNGLKLEELKNEHKNNKTILEIIKIIYEEFENVRLKGSLIQPEKKLFPLFEEYKNRIAKKELSKSKRIKKKQIEGQNTLEKEELLTLFEYKFKRDFTKEEKELLESLNYIYSEAIKSNDISKQLFATEAVKSVKLVDIFMKQYDIVVTNPPYMGKRNMNEKLKDFVKKSYNGFDDDLYSVFIYRCKDFLLENGRLGMVTQQSFMFIKSFSFLREWLLQNLYIYKLCHLGTRAFADISGEKVNTVMFVLENKICDKNMNSEFINLTFLNSADEKEMLISSSKLDNFKYYINQNEFKVIEGFPLNYWLDSNIRNLFKSPLKIENISDIVLGMKTSNNAKFIRYFWELSDETKEVGWKPYEKEATGNPYYGLSRYFVKWDKESLEHYKTYYSAQLPNKKYWFRKGIAFGLVSGSKFCAKFLPSGYMTDMASNLITFTQDDENEIFYVLGLLNSTLYNYLLNSLNPSINFQVNDVKRLPYLSINIKLKETIIRKSKEIYNLKKELYCFNELDEGFKYPILASKKLCKLSNIYEEAYENSMLIKNRINDLLIEIDDILFNEFNITESIKNSIISETNSSDNLKILDLKSEVKNLLSYIIGSIFNRWIKENTIYENDGIIPLDSSIYLDNDLIERLNSILEGIYGENYSDVIMDEIELILGDSLEKYFKQDFYKDHLKMYEKRPIYWHICSPKKTFNCLVYYHKLNEDTLYKIKSIYLSQMINRYQEDLKYYTNQLIQTRVIGNKNKEKEYSIKCNDLELKLDDLSLFNSKIMEILPYKPDIDQGVLYNIIPLEPILSSSVSTDKEREEYYKEVKK